MLLDLFSWWYGEGWVDAWKSIPRNLKKVQQTFTLPVLLGTLFSPWKQIVSSGGKSIDEKFRAMIDNLVSRTIGFFVRLLVLFAALVIMAGVAIFGLVIAVGWPLIPLAVVVCIVGSVK